MKKLTFLVIATFLTTSVLLSSCNTKKAEQAEHDHHNEMDSTATAYSCPMHPEEKGKAGDKCSKCGMPLEAVNTTDTTKTN